MLKNIKIVRILGAEEEVHYVAGFPKSCLCREQCKSSLIGSLEERLLFIPILTSPLFYQKTSFPLELFSLSISMPSLLGLSLG